ncbi:Ankyrin repeat domain-containing protein [Plasmodiophora brassicae]
MSIGNRTRNASTTTWPLRVLAVALLIAIGVGERQLVKLRSSDDVDIDADAAAITMHSGVLKDLLEQSSASNDNTCRIVVKMVASPVLQAIVDFCHEFAVDEVCHPQSGSHPGAWYHSRAQDAAAAEWLRNTLWSMDAQGYVVLLEAAHVLRMPTLGRVLLATRQEWDAIRALAYNLFDMDPPFSVFIVMNCPIIAKLRQRVRTSEQMLIVDRIPYAVVNGDQGQSDVDFINSAEWDPTVGNVLQWATARGNARLVELLAGIPGINANTNTLGMVPLHWAALNGDARIVAALFTIRGVDANVGIGPSGLTPLHLAAFWGFAEVVALLLDSPGVDVNARDGDGMTPLMLAAMKGHLQVVTLLLTEVGTKDKRGMAALQRAMEAGEEEVEQLLKGLCLGASKRFRC